MIPTYIHGVLIFYGTYYPDFYDICIQYPLHVYE